jgi:hypothetical protein
MVRWTVRATAGFALALIVLASAAAEARSRNAFPYDGPWQLTFTTRAGPCESYDFQVNIRRGIISHPNLVRFHGAVSPKGLARASVAVSDKSAAGTGRLTLTDGSGSWSGRSGTARCSGRWIARRS